MYSQESLAAIPGDQTYPSDPDQGVQAVVALVDGDESGVGADVMATLTMADVDISCHRWSRLHDVRPLLGQADILLVALPADGAAYLAELADLREMVRSPIIAVLTDADSPARVRALESGADACLAWPFDGRELLALCRAALRRACWERRRAGDTWPFYQDAHLEISLDRRYALCGGRAVGLSATEVSILRELLATPGQVVPYEQLLKQVWGHQAGRDNHVLREAIRRLRRKIEPDPARPRYLLTQPWVGLRFRPLAEKLIAPWLPRHAQRAAGRRCAEAP